MYNRKRLDSKETVSVRQSFEAHSSSHPEVSRPGDGNRAVRKEIDRKHTAQASPRAKTVKLTDLVDNCGDICRNDPKFGRVFIREMALLLEILHEGDSRLYAMAEKKMRSCEALLAKEAAAETDDEDDEQELLRLLSRRISPGRRGIKLFTGAFAARSIQEPLLSIDVESLASAAFTSDAFSAPVFGVRRKGVVTDYLAREDIGGSDAPPDSRPRQPRRARPSTSNPCATTSPTARISHGTTGPRSSGSRDAWNRFSAGSSGRRTGRLTPPRFFERR